MVAGGREDAFVPGIFSTVWLGCLPGARARLWPPAEQAALPPSPVPGSAAPSRASPARPGKVRAAPAGPQRPAPGTETGDSLGAPLGTWRLALQPSSRRMG